MMLYPEILGSTGTDFREIPNAYVFDKLDGQNLRFEWSKKQGWHKYGTRTTMFDASNPQFGPAIPLFLSTLAISTSGVLLKLRWPKATIFCEYFGPESLAGDHGKTGPTELRIIDVANPGGLIEPKEYIKHFGHLAIAKYIGQFNWTRGFVQRVRENDIPGITFEGVVGKTNIKKERIMAKAKTQQWYDRTSSVTPLHSYQDIR